MASELRVDPGEVKPEPLLSASRLRAFFHREGRTVAPLELFPIKRFLKDYTPQKLKADGKAALNVALLDVPQGMAYALIAGLPFYMGLYSSALASFLSPIFASSRHIMVGPTNAIAVLTLSAFLSLSFAPDQVLLAMPLLLIMIGTFMLIGGFLRVANLINYVSRTVVTGYITAAAFLIIAKQLKNMLGVSTPQSATFVDSAFAVFEALPATHLPSLGLALGTMVFFILLQRTLKGFPNVAVTLLVMYFVAYWLATRGWAVQTLSPVPLKAGVWPLTVPRFSFELVGQLAGPAMAIAFLSLLESASIAKTLAARAGDSVNINQQMISMGIANFGCAFASGMPISGSLTRSALNYSSGAVTPMSSIFSALLLGVAILLLAPYLADIPVPALSALVFLVGVSLLNKRNVRIALGSTNSDAAVFLVTFISGLIFPLDNAIFLGVGTSVFLFMRKAGAPDMMEYAFSESGREVRPSERLAISLLHVDGNLFFGSSDMFLQQARLMTDDPNIRVVILRLRNAHNLDATCAMALEQLVRFAKEKDRHVLVSGAHPEVIRVLRNSGVLELIGPGNVFREDEENPTRSTSQALKRAKELVGANLDVRLFVREKAAEEQQ